MPSRSSRALGALTCAVALLLLPSAAAAWTVDVYTYGAGRIDETTSANLMDCTTPLTQGEDDSYTCSAGSPDGGYGHFWTVRLEAKVPDDYYAHGWRFSHWGDGTENGQIQCDDGQPDNVCQFMISSNLWVRAYFTDDVAPDTSLSGGPEAGRPTNQTSATFNFDSPDPSVDFWCMLDGPDVGTPDWYLCGNQSDKGESYGGLSMNGAYTFRVRAKDPSDNTDPSEAARSWIVDTVAPTATISGGPAQDSTVASTAASFGLAAGESGATVRCRIDVAAFAPCGASVSFADLAQGRHDFDAYAVDAAGNVGPTVRRTWYVDTVAPETSDVGGSPSEGASTESTSAEFTFMAEPGATFQCALDGGAWEACTSPRQITALAVGSHTFAVRAIDGAGNVDATPSTRAWTVVAPATPPADDPGTGTPAPGTPSPGPLDPPPVFDPPPVIAPPPARVESPVRNRWRVRRARTQVLALTVRSVPAGGSVRVSCNGRRCPFKKRTFKPRRGNVSLRRAFRRPLRPRTQIEIRITAPGMVGKVVRYSIRRGKLPRTRTLCLPVGASKPQFCT